MKPVIKGSLITVNINGYEFEFFHQSTEFTEDGTLVLGGQGLRWLMSRRTRSRTVKDISLKTLATQVAKAHGVKLDYQSTIDPVYEHLDQTAKSDYALLVRETEAAGLTITEDKKSKTLVIKELKQYGEPAYTLERGLNLISYKISDKAFDPNSPDISTKLPSYNKTVIDPISGKHVNTKKDVDRAKSSNTTTGAAKPKVVGTMKAGDAAVAVVAAGKKKRIAGLPSTFVVPMSDETLAFSPATTMLTKGFPGCLDRIWIVKTVTHSLSAGTSTLVLNSPVEVTDTGKTPVIPGAKPEAGIATGDWVYPVSGTVTSLQTWRNGRMHRGVDIGASEGTPIYSAEAGTIFTNAFQAGGAGNYVMVKHNIQGKTLFTVYMHMVAPSPLAVGTVVAKGEQIGQVGNTGGSRGAHLHFELKNSDVGGHLQVANTFPKLARVTQGIIAKAPVK